MGQEDDDDLTRPLSPEIRREMQRIISLQQKTKTNKQNNSMPVKKAVAGKAVNTPEALKEKTVSAPAGGGGKKGSKLGSLEDVFNSTPAGSGISWPEGEFKARLTMAELIEDEKSDRVSACFTYTGHEDEEESRVNGKDAKQYYQLMTADGDPGAGIGFLKGDLEQLGYPDTPLSELEEVFKTLSNEEPEVLVKVKQNGKYTNLYLQKVYGEGDDE